MNMTVICPTVLADDTHVFRQQMERVASFAKRVHIDFADGDFAPTKTISLKQAWWPEGIAADLHVMYKNPSNEINRIIKLKPNLVVVHVEAEGNFTELAQELHKVGIKVGLALLPETELSKIEPVIDILDHVLIFAGKLGYFGGEPEIGKFVHRIKAIKANYPNIEVGWDGGVTDKNTQELAELGVDVLNVGGYIQRAANPQQRYQALTRIVS